jgi:DNA recombination protein RmuC
VGINPDSGEQVDFALRLPGSDKNSVVWLPMDAKFPMEPYQNVLDAINNGDQDSINLLQKELINTLKRYAKELNTKFINPPHTTEFALLFIPVEGMYADIVRAPGVIETLQRDYSITIAGPTTFAALLNSLQMGFRTIAIQRRSTEVWHLLGAVKTEFNHFEKVLTKAQKRLHLASDEIELLVGQKTRQIQKRLLQVESLPHNETSTLLDIEDELLEEYFEQLEENMANEIQETL